MRQVFLPALLPDYEHGELRVRLSMTTARQPTRRPLVLNLDVYYPDTDLRLLEATPRQSR